MNSAWNIHHSLSFSPGRFAGTAPLAAWCFQRAAEVRFGLLIDGVQPVMATIGCGQFHFRYRRVPAREGGGEALLSAQHYSYCMTVTTHQRIDARSGSHGLLNNVQRPSPTYTLLLQPTRQQCVVDVHDAMTFRLRRRLTCTVLQRHVSELSVGQIVHLSVVKQVHNELVQPWIVRYSRNVLLISEHCVHRPLPHTGP